MTAIVIGAVVAPVATLVVTRQRNAVVAADEIVVRISGRTADLLADELSDASRTIEVISLLLDGAIEEGSVGTLLGSQVRSLPQLSGAFVGFPDGGFTFVRRDPDSLTLKHIDTSPNRVVTEARLDDNLSAQSQVIIEDTYDPRTRPWYSAAETTDGLIWTEPYVFFSSGKAGVTAAASVRDAVGSLVAIVGVDIDLEQLTSILDGLPIENEADAFIVAEDVVVAAPPGYEVAHTADGEVALATPLDVGLDRETLAQARTQTAPVPASDGGRLYTIAFDDPDLPDWDVALRTGQLDFVDDVRRQSQIALTATIVAALALLTTVPVLMTRLRGPLDELTRRARIDHLTGLANRATLLDEGGRELKRARRWHQDIAVAMLDIDNFKSVNDQYGHGVGDETIRSIADELLAAVRSHDLVARLGGDEFIVVLRDLSERDTQVLLERVRQRLLASWRRDARAEALGVTIGVARAGGRVIELIDLIEEADRRLMSAKRSDKGSIVAV
jgi:diguanylate cyclase (GGDEF)-like protein